MKEEDEYLEAQKKCLGWSEKMEEDFNKELFNRLKGISWEEWSKTYPAREVLIKPEVEEHCIFEEYIEAEIYRDRSEVFDECAYEVALFEGRYYVVSKV